MELKVCKKCRRLFKYIYGPELCQDCTKLIPESEENPKDKESLATVRLMVRDDEKKFEQVRDYIMQNPIATITEIAQVNDVTPMKLFEWIKEERLEFSDNSEYAWFKCEKCGTKIKSGRMCNRCKIK